MSHRRAFSLHFTSPHMKNDDDDGGGGGGGGAAAVTWQAK